MIVIVNMIKPAKTVVMIPIIYLTSLLSELISFIRSKNLKSVSVLIANDPLKLTVVYKEKGKHKNSGSDNFRIFQLCLEKS